jgi:hypothetical protein
MFCSGVIVITITSQTTEYSHKSHSTIDSQHNKTIAQVSGKVVINEESIIFHFLYHFVVFDTNLINSTTTFSYSKRTKFSKICGTSTSASSQAILFD